MTSTPYSRVYHRLMTEYPTVWRSDSQLALLVRLLVAADKFYPEWPTSNRRNGAYQSLLRAGLVIEKEGTDHDLEANGTPLDGDRSPKEGKRPTTNGGAVPYTIRGLEAERERRTHAGRNAAASRWGMPRRDETSKEETSKPNGNAPTLFMGYKPKAGEHVGQHGVGCSVCLPLLEKIEP